MTLWKRDTTSSSKTTVFDVGQETTICHQLETYQSLETMYEYIQVGRLKEYCHTGNIIEFRIIFALDIGLQRVSSILKTVLCSCVLGVWDIITTISTLDDSSTDQETLSYHRLWTT